MNNLQFGTIYQSTTHGMVEYLGTDRYWGELTFHFRSHTYRQEAYIKPEELEKFLVPQESIETVKQQRDELLAAAKVLLVVLNKYASTTSNVEVVTSADEEIAAAYRQARKAISSVEGCAS